jgi:Protein of unknown function (DUF2537)
LPDSFPGRQRPASSSGYARLVTDESTPWATGLTVAGFVAAVSGVAVVVLSLGLIRVHPILAVGLNIVAAGGLAPTLWGWRHTAVLRWLVLGVGVGVTAAWLTLVSMTVLR